MILLAETGHLVGSTRWADEVIDAFGGVYDLIDVRLALSSSL